MTALHRRRSLAGLLAVSLAASTLAQAPCDGTFHGRRACQDDFYPNLWTLSYIGTPGGAATAINSSGCGSPPPGGSITCSVNASSGYAYAGIKLLCPTATWSPDSAATTVSMSIDNVVENSSGSGQAVFPMLRQGGDTYLGPVAATGLPATWTTLTLPHIPESGFAKLIGPNFTTDPNAHPDFSSAGAVITFGFVIGNSGSVSYSRTHCYDNWEIVLDEPASFASYGTGCGVDCPDSFVEYLPPGSFDLANTATYTMIPNGSGYTVLTSLASGSSLFVAPTGAATVLPLGDDAEAIVTPSTPFPTQCDGLANHFVVCSNGFVSLGSNGTDYVPDVAQMLTAANSAWWSWHDFDPSVAGSGKVKFEEVSSVAYFTWDDVWDFGSTAGSTFQFQFDLATGVVTLVHLNVSPFGSAHVVGYSRGGTALGACVADLSAANTLQLCCSPMGTTPLHLTMLDQPVIGTTPRFETSNIPPCTLFTVVAFGTTPIAYDLTPFMPGCFLLHDLLLPFGPIILSPGATATTTYGLLSPVPNLLGARAYAQAVAWVGGLQTGITSNGIEMVLGY